MYHIVSCCYAREMHSVYHFMFGFLALYLRYEKKR